MYIIYSMDFTNDIYFAHYLISFINPFEYCNLLRINKVTNNILKSSPQFTQLLKIRQDYPDLEKFEYIVVIYLYQSKIPNLVSSINQEYLEYMYHNMCNHGLELDFYKFLYSNYFDKLEDFEKNSLFKKTVREINVSILLMKEEEKLTELNIVNAILALNYILENYKTLQITDYDHTFVERIMSTKKYLWISNMYLGKLTV